MPSAPRPPAPQRPLRAVDYVDRLPLEGRYHFTTEEAAGALGLSEVAARAAIRLLKKRGVVAAPMRGFHVLVSPEHRAAGCPPAELFIGELMAHVGAPYYVGLLSAAVHHGAADPPDVSYVVTHDNRPEIRCGSVNVVFVARKNAAEIPFQTVRTLRGQVRVSTPEATAADLVAYPQYTGGLEEVALALLGLADRIDPGKLVEAAALYEMPSAQRLGYLLDRVGASGVTEPLAEYVAAKAPITTPLDPKRPKTDAPRDGRWRLVVNADIGGGSG